MLIDGAGICYVMNMSLDKFMCVCGNLLSLPVLLLLVHMSICMCITGVFIAFRSIVYH